MTILILCCAFPASVPARLDAAGFASFCRNRADLAIERPPVKQILVQGRDVYLAGGEAPRQTAELLLAGPVELSREPLLDEVPMAPFADTAKALPLGLWLRMAWLQRSLGSSRQPESKKAALKRADALIDKLERRERDCILIGFPAFIALLLERFRARGWCDARSGVFAVQSLERILLTRRDDHCGGCSHNCLLTNPGCGVGRDKAMRKSLHAGPPPEDPHHG